MPHCLTFQKRVVYPLKWLIMNMVFNFVMTIDHEDLTRILKFVFHTTYLLQTLLERVYKRYVGVDLYWLVKQTVVLYLLEEISL